MKKLLLIITALAVVFASNPAFAKAKSNKSSTAAQTAEVQKTTESAQDYSNRASLRFLKRDMQGAIADFNKAISIEPNNPQLYLNRGYLKHVMNDFNGAMADYNTSLQLNPNFAFAYNNRGVLKVALNDIQGALADYEKALTLNRNYADVYYNRGNLRFMLNDNQGALADYDKAIEINPKDSEAYNNRGVVKKRMNYNVGALSDYSQAIALNPKDSIAYANRGRLKKLYFDNEGAAIDLDQAVALAETQVFIKNVKPLLSNEQYIAAVPVVQGITNNPPMIKVEPRKEDKLVFNVKDNAEIPYAQPSTPGSSPQRLIAMEQEINTIPAIAEKQEPKPEQRSAQIQEQRQEPQRVASSSTTLNAGIGKVALSDKQPSAMKTPTTNARLAESYYIRGLQKCVLRDLQGAIADLDKAIANNSKYADAYFYRGAIRKELGDVEGFKKDYATAIQLNPSLQKFNDSNALALIQG